MAIRRWIAAVGLLMLCITGTGTATAAEQPQVVDGCGTDGIAADPAEGVTTPWTDVCSGVFETLPGGDGLKVTATFAGDIPDDRIGLYATGWRVGDCAYRVTHETGIGEHRSNGVVISDVGGDWLRVRCGAGVVTTCHPDVPLSVCQTWPDERHYPVVDAVTVAGKTVTWTVRFTGELAALGARHTVGTQLTNLRVEAATKAVLVATNPSFCYGTACSSVGGDIAYGAGYTIGE